MSTEKDIRELVIVNELSQLLGKAFTIYNKITGEAFGLDGQAIINIASAAFGSFEINENMELIFKYVAHPTGYNFEIRNGSLYFIIN